MTWVDMLGAYAATYGTEALSLADTGRMFRCVVTNALGEATSAAALLTVVGAPALVSMQTTSVQAPNGGTATFVASVSGTAPVTCGWQVSVSGGPWTDIAGANETTYVIDPVTADMDGCQYRCTASNPYGSDVSLAATLNVQIVHYVKWDAAGANSGGSWEDAFTDLQDALAAAQPGEQIWVSAGTYAPDAPGGSAASTFLLPTGVSVYGGFAGIEKAVTERDSDANTTVMTGDLDGDGFVPPNSKNVVTGGDGALLDGFVVTGGDYRYTNWDGGGAGMQVLGVTMTVANCRFRHNRCELQGGGMYVLDSAVLITDCTFEGNTGGSYYSLSPVGGGGMHCEGSSVDVRNCLFVRNQSPGYGWGGGVSSIDCTGQVSGCRFFDGFVGNGGGALRLQNAGMTVDACHIVGNCCDAPSTVGNSIRVSGTGVRPLFANCLIAGGDEGPCFSMYSGSAADIVNCTFAGNPYDIDARSCVVAVTNCLMWEHPPSATYATFTTAVILYSDLEGGWDGPGVSGIACTDNGTGSNIDADPLFASAPTGVWTANSTYDDVAVRTVLSDDAAAWAENGLAGLFVNPDTSQLRLFAVESNTATTITVYGDASALATSGVSYALRDFHLSASSPCVNAGTTVPGLTQDLDGDARVGHPDIGAYEY